jgi:hypothetical protein
VNLRVNSKGGSGTTSARRVLKGSKYLFERLGERGRWFTYGNFYAAPAQYMIGGETWQNWYAKISGILLAQVKENGEFVFWDGDGTVGPLYETAVNVMILSMPYQFIPLYQR